MPSWPVTLPAIPMRSGFSESLPKLLSHSQTEVGPGKVRRRTTANVRPLRWVHEYTPAQVATLEAFFLTTLVGGALTFDYNHPRTGAAGTFRFTPSQPPDWSAINDSPHYAVTISLDLLP